MKIQEHFGCKLRWFLYLIMMTSAGFPLSSLTIADLGWMEAHVPGDWKLEQLIIAKYHHRGSKRAAEWLLLKPEDETCCRGNVGFLRLTRHIGCRYIDTHCHCFISSPCLLQTQFFQHDLAIHMDFPQALAKVVQFFTFGSVNSWEIEMEPENFKSYVPLSTCQICWSYHKYDTFSAHWSCVNPGRSSEPSVVRASGKWWAWQTRWPPCTWLTLDAHLGCNAFGTWTSVSCTSLCLGNNFRHRHKFPLSLVDLCSVVSFDDFLLLHCPIILLRAYSKPLTTAVNSTLCIILRLTGSHLL